MRILIAGFMHESNTFATTPADRRRFEEGSTADGSAVIPIWKDAHHEFGGFIEAADRLGFQAEPGLMAWATPSGPVDDGFFEETADRIADQCARADVDGVLLALHGAMVTRRRPDADTEILRRIRSRTSKPLAVTFDFHGNIDPSAANLAPIMVGYQTYPHVDQRNCGRKAAELLVRQLRGELQPVAYVAKRPMIAGILGQATDHEPMRTLMSAAREQERRPGIAAVSVMGGFQYADVPAMGPSILVVADGDPEKARATAEQLADTMWQLRRQFDVATADPAEAVARALAAPRGPVVLVDLGDNIGGGSAGDGTVILQEMVKQQAQGGVVPLFAPESAAVCRALGTGARFEGVVGGKVDDRHGPPVRITGTIETLHDGKWIETEARHGGRRHNDQGLTAVVRTDDGIRVLLNSLRTPPFSLGQLTSAGIDPSTASMIVVKAAVAYKAAYAPIAGGIIEVDTPGVTAVNPRRFTYARIPRPIFPLDADAG